MLCFCAVRAWQHEREKERERRRTCKLVTVSIRPHVEAQRIGYHLKESMYNRRKKELQYLHVPLLSEIDVILSERHQTIRLFIKLLSFLLCSGDQTGDILTCSVISFPSRIGKYWDSSIVCKEKKKKQEQLVPPKFAIFCVHSMNNWAYFID
jgi:hypothetical protein